MIIKFLAGLIGFIIIFNTLGSAVRTFIMPRAINDPLAKFLFQFVRKIFDLFMIPANTYEAKDQILAFYAPIALLMLPLYWLTLLTIGFSGIYYALGVSSWAEAFTISGSSLLTLGFSRGIHTYPVIEFTQAALGPLMIALLISYLPTMYAAFHDRELVVNRLTVRAGSPPSPVVMLLRFHRLDLLDQLGTFFIEWEDWFVNLEQSHTSLSALVFFRSSNPGDSWVNAAGCILDAAALRLALIDVSGDLEPLDMLDGVNRMPADARAAIAIRAGFIALRRIADFFNVDYNPNPQYPLDPVSISRADFNRTIEIFTEFSIPIKTDHEQAWQDYAGWRVNYDSVLNALKHLTMAPDAKWFDNE